MHKASFGTLPVGVLFQYQGVRCVKRTPATLEWIAGLHQGTVEGIAADTEVDTSWSDHTRTQGTVPPPGDATRLAPCPFCGTPEPMLLTVLERPGANVLCRNYTTCRMVGPWGATREEAIVRWNTHTRPTHAPPQRTQPYDHAFYE